MRAAPVHEPDPPFAVAEDHQVLAQDPERDRQVGDLRGQRHRVPEPSQVLPARGAGADADELLVGPGVAPGSVSPIVRIPEPAGRRRPRLRAGVHRRCPTTSSWKLRTESSHTGESMPPSAAASDARPCWSRSQMAWSSWCTSRHSLAIRSVRSADRGPGTETVDGAALQRAVRRERHVVVHADLIGEVDPEREGGEQGEEAGVRRQGVVPFRLAGDVDGASEAARIVDGVVVGERLLRGRGVHELDVVGLDEVLHQELPVRGHLPEVERDEVAHPVEVEPLEPAAERGDEVLERGGGAVQVHEDPVAPRRAPHRCQPVPCAVEAGRRRARVAPAEVRGDVQRAVEPVRPRVIGAADRPPDVAGRVDELEAPVAAHVVEGADPALRVAHQQHRPAGHGDRRRVAGSRQLVRKAGEHPRPGEDPLPLQREERIARVGRGRQAGGHRARGLERGQRPRTHDRLERGAHARPPGERCFGRRRHFTGPRPPPGRPGPPRMGEIFTLRHMALEQELVLEHAEPGHDLDVRDIGLTVNMIVEEIR